VSWTWIQISSPAIALGFGALALIYAIAGRRRFERTFSSGAAKGTGATLFGVPQIKTLMAWEFAGSKRNAPMLWLFLAIDVGAFFSLVALFYSLVLSQGGVEELLSVLSPKIKLEVTVALAVMVLVILSLPLVMLILFRLTNRFDFQREMDEAANKVTKELLDKIRTDHASR
jgi:hypothetical protein